LGWAEDVDGGRIFVEVVGDASNERCFRARDEKVEMMLFGMLDQGGEV
jgi:hypothetical protein